MWSYDKCSFALKQHFCNRQDDFYDNNIKYLKAPHYKCVRNVSRHYQKLMECKKKKRSDWYLLKLYV